MRMIWCVSLVALCHCTMAVAQVGGGVRSSADPRPAQWPDPTADLPLVPVPATPITPPPSECGRGGSYAHLGEYDPTRYYLPDVAPVSAKPRFFRAHPCDPAGDFWLAGEFLYWATQGNPVPLVLTAPAPGTPLQAVNALPQGWATHALDSDWFNNGMRPGLRINTGIWLDELRHWGGEGTFFFLQDARQASVWASPGLPILARPVIDPVSGAAAIRPFAFPESVAGALAISSTLTILGAEANTRSNFLCSDRGRADFFAGYRFLGLNEGLSLYEVRQQLASGMVTSALDSFSTHNQFHGGQIGWFGEYRAGRFYADVAAKVAFGVSFQRVRLDGAQVLEAPANSPASVLVPGGALVSAQYAGTYLRNDFAVVPEVSVSLGYQLTRSLRTFVGYNFLYLSAVARPSSVLELALSPAGTGDTAHGPLLGEPLPRSRFLDTANNFWVQGVSLGLEWRY
jgi:hypothetical protein